MTSTPIDPTRPLVLVVDDDESMRLLVRETVEGFGFSAVEATNGREAVIAFERYRPAAVLLDVVMPEMDGFETCEALRSRPGAALVPIVMMTSLNDMESVDRAYEAGATDFITKPLNYVLLGHRLRYILRAKRTVDELQNAERRLATAQRIASLGSWEIDLASRSLRICDELYRILAIDATAFRGQPEHLWSAAHPEDREHVVQSFERAIDKKQPLRVEYRMIGNDGERIIHQEGEISVDDERGSPLLVGTAQDITERKKAEQKLVHLSVLSDTVNVVAGSADFVALVEQVASRLRRTLGAEHVAVFDWPTDEVPRRIQPPRSRDQEEEPVSARQLALLEEARRSLRTVETVDGGRCAWAIPMRIRATALGCLYFEGPADSLSADASDIVFLQSLAQQLAVALDRARLSEQNRRRQETERRQLKEEVAELRQVSGRVELLFRSAPMKQMFETIERIAPTDATVLVTGESGTGKELVAHSLHRLSDRRKKPLVVVDCAALPTTLIESELFGHEKGAFTGAQQRKVGRLAEANGGTVFLDEIGELPLEVQSKLLRFVQEKQISPVGGTRTLRVDARLVAATNRDLGAEVSARRFREDLFYRLNVIRIKVPSLRERHEDVALLANHFLESFAAQYQKPPLRFTPEAEAALARHPWTGNVRELKNRVLQAVILSESAWIGPELIGLDTSGERERSTLDTQGAPTARRETSSVEPSSLPTATEVWNELRSGLREVLERLLASSQSAPLGEWLMEDLVLESYRAAEGVLSRAAMILGVAEATYRRKYRKLEDASDSELGRSTTWSRVRASIRHLVRLGDAVDGDRTRRARDVLLEEVVRVVPDNAVECAALMGVSPPTFRRWVRDITATECDREDALDAVQR